MKQTETVFYTSYLILGQTVNEVNNCRYLILFHVFNLQVAILIAPKRIVFAMKKWRTLLNVHLRVGRRISYRHENYINTCFH